VKVHCTGISGAGMGALARLFQDAGHEVRGSDTAFDAPVGPELLRAGIATMQGYAEANLAWEPDLVIVGNAIRRDNPEATFVRDRGLRALSMSSALREYFLARRTAIVVAGTHGKTTTSAICAELLSRADFGPGYFIGGLPKGLPGAAAIGRKMRSLLAAPLSNGEGGVSTLAPPFVVEGDEYDAVYWHKHPKFLDYIGGSAHDMVLLTSIEYDHIDIYSSEAAYENAFDRLAESMSEDGLWVCDASSPAVRRVSAKTRARQVYYALSGDTTGAVEPTWLGAPAPLDALGRQPFDLYAGGVLAGRFVSKVPGLHNVRNAIGAIALLAEGFGVSLKALRSGLSEFEGVRRRQDLIGEPGGIRVYDDFAHHPTAVRETLSAFRTRHPKGRLFVAFEARSATACRNLHQKAYESAFGSADRVILAPLGRANIPAAERLDLSVLATALGPKAMVAESIDSIVQVLVAEAKSGDTIALLSNGAFGGIYTKLLAALEAKIS
jgi:UDP-N-acetylmuramate: L-alanyl-gamma-D-glutamyl-meso-diaminopimelate ligase